MANLLWLAQVRDIVVDNLLVFHYFFCLMLSILSRQAIASRMYHHHEVNRAPLTVPQVADFRRIPPAEKPAFIKLVEDLTAVLTMNITSLRAAVLPGLLSSYAALGYPNRKAAQALLEAMAVGIADSDGRSRLSGDNLFAALAAAAALGYRPAPGTVRIIVNASHKDLR